MLSYTEVKTYKLKKRQIFGPPRKVIKPHCLGNIRVTKHAYFLTAMR